MSLSAIYVPSPGGMALDSAGNLFIADTNNHRIRRVSPSGLITTVAGTGHQGFSGDDGPAIDADMYLPTGIAFDRNGNLFISERGNNLIRRVSTSGIITTVAGGRAPTGQSIGDGGPATTAVLLGPAGLAVDGNGSLFIADSLNNRVHKVTPDGVITTIAGSGAGGANAFSGDGGSALNAQLSFPIGVALDGVGNLLILQIAGRVRRVSADGTISTIVGSKSPGLSGDGGPATSAGFTNPFAITTDSSNNVYIADTANNRIRKIAPDGTIITTAGGDVLADAPIGDGGPATSAQLVPFAVAADSAGNLFIADSAHNRIRRVSPGGTITTVAGTGASGFSGDGGPAINAQLNYPTALALDTAGDLFFADGGTRIRKVSTDGTINTVAGNGTMGFPSGLGDGGPAISASLSGFVGGLAIDAGGNLFIADTDDYRIRKVSADGTIRTVAGGGTSFKDGVAATEASLYPWGIVFDGGGNLFVASQSGGLVRKVSPGGIITTVAGKADFSLPSGDGGPATNALIPSPTGLALDGAGNLFIADNYIDDFGPLPCCDNRIRKVSPDGIISTVAGIGISGYSGGTEVPRALQR
jgi:sugar lactone lactonase YvrE